ncbi:MAG: NAD-dependent epimerase/dehydratase family protein [Planctomycetota bacterium]
MPASTEPTLTPIVCFVTGAGGFIGRNLVTALRRNEEVEVLSHLSNDTLVSLKEKLNRADVIYHLAGSNRPVDEMDFQRVNTGLTETIASHLKQRSRPVKLVFSSSIQATRGNAYGESKKGGEEALIQLAAESPHSVAIYRLPNVFGKWSRPNYNTVVATFCHNVARDLPITISNPDQELHLVYIDEVVRCFLRHISDSFQSENFVNVDETHHITLGQLAETIREFRDSRTNLKTPPVSEPLIKYLYTTYLSFLPRDKFAYDVQLRTDDRGWLFELAKSESFGQIFVSTTKPGITRGNHYHDTKVEKFCLVKGEGVIRFRDIESTDVIEYPVNDRQIQIVDIPPGFTHSIENTGEVEMIVLFWANEVFDPQQPDTYWVPVLKNSPDTRL